MMISAKNWKAQRLALNNSSIGNVPTLNIKTKNAYTLQQNYYIIPEKDALVKISKQIYWYVFTILNSMT
jgi:hypothetical protein